MFFRLSRWFAAVDKEHGFLRVHDKTLLTVAMSALLEITAGAVAAELHEGWPGIVVPRRWMIMPASPHPHCRSRNVFWNDQVCVHQGR